jgi:RimJ/RimL family protein N-acetyltransferase
MSQSPAQLISSDTRIVSTARGEFILRPERPEDEPFLSHLFAANNTRVLHQAGFPLEVIEKLISFQFHSQTRTFREMFPEAIYSIINWDGKEVGRFIENDERDAVYFVDFVLFPDYQAIGLGTALTRALMQEWAARGRDTRVKVMINNEASLKMCRKLGFVQGETDETAHVELRWSRPPA